MRLTLGAALLTLIARPWRTWPQNAPVVPLIGLGIAMAATVLLFYFAIARLPLGAAISLQFLGPLGVAVFGSRRLPDLAWALLAVIGTWLLVGAGSTTAALDLVGVACALGAAVGWASYILLGSRVSNSFGGSTAALSVGLAALFMFPAGAEPAANLLSALH